MKEFKSLMVRVAAFAIAFAFIFFLSLGTGDADAGHAGYYRYPAIHGDTIVFTAEGDLWKVSTKGGVATRLTSDAGEETDAAISPDGRTVAFSGQYEGPTDVYTMPIDGGTPQRRTWDDAAVAGWTPDGRLLVRTARYSDLPDPKLVAIDNAGHREIIPLASAAQGSYTPDGKTLFFTRNNRQPSWTKRYKGGTAENIWRYDAGAKEAVALTGDYAGTSDDPMFWKGRVYFLSDRDGVMNVWSMDEDGHNLKEETHQRGLDARSASLSDGHIVYQCGADLWLLDLRSGKDSIVPITLVSDFDQMRDYWVTKPLEYLTSAHIAPDGSAAVFTVRGEVFALPAKPGRIVKVAGDSAVRYREARYMPDGKSVIALSTKTGETEFWKFPANGEGDSEQLTSDAKVLRYEGIPSPDGNWIAFYDKNDALWLYDAKTKQDKKIAQSMNGGFSDLNWSPDSQWLAYVESANNTFDQIKVLNVNTGAIQAVTDDRYNSRAPSWSADGKWMYFLSDRMLKSTVYSPWGPRQPDPNFNRSIKIYQLALIPGLRSPFAPPDELHPDKPATVEEPKSQKAKESESKEAAPKKPAVAVDIDFKNLASRLEEVPVPPGNYYGLESTDKRLCWLNRDEEPQPKLALQCLDIANKGAKPETVMADVRSFEVSLDRKKVLVRKNDDFYIFDSDAKAAAIGNPEALSKAKIDVSGWTWVTNRRSEFRGLFLDSWRNERDYFYDRHMNGVNWESMRERYLPLVDRVTDRNELNDVIAQMVSELSALHTFVCCGDARKPSDDIDIGSLGAVLRRDEQAGGDVVQHIYLHDPDLPNEAPPFARPESLIHEGEVIISIDGQSVLSVPDTRELLRGKAGHQVLLHVKSTEGKLRDVVVRAISAREDSDLRYAEWEYTRRLAVDAASHGTIGYVHLRAMGPGDIAQWARDFYPVYDRQGLIIDMRHNRGGNIDSWVLGKLLRKAWFYFQPAVGNPTWNMQYAFRGHIVVLCDQLTASDGEAFTEGFKRLGLGKVIGMRTWGGEIWLSFGDTAVQDNGVASAAELGVYGPERKWLIEGHGVDPDVVVDDLPHATFEGKDAQLEAGIKLLEEEIQKDPRPVPPHPPYPDKSFKYAQ
ncbi:MAG TPA: S41 family peptidase [Candidatus Acidoferrales bacterium]|nr:S41 family peptidase [Candidatus Acidoferrales bacterium]